MLTPTQRATYVALFLTLAIAVGLYAVSITSVRPITQRIDGVQVVKTRDAGWQVLKPGDYADTLLGSLVPEYGWSLNTAPVSLPNTSGQCESFLSCVTGGH